MNSPRLKRERDRRNPERGQSTAEFAIVIPILILIFFGLAFAAYYAFRATSADWAAFITGTAEGAYSRPGNAGSSILWSDIRSSVSTTKNPDDRQVSVRVSLNKHARWIYGILLEEVHDARTHFRLWRFYPGPPPPGGVE
jgi:hypothetical protein